MAHYVDTMPVADALSAHFEKGGFAKDGGYGAAWVRFRVGPVPLAFPNIEARRKVVRFHDVHHVVTGYDTDWTGEMEIGAWEIATGCAHYWVAWFLNLGVFGVGALLRPHRTFRAWCRGRRCLKNFFQDRYDPLLLQTVGALRSQVGLDWDTSNPTFTDRCSFAFWAGIGGGLALLELAIPVLLIWCIVVWLS